MKYKTEKLAGLLSGFAWKVGGFRAERKAKEGGA